MNNFTFPLEEQHFRIQNCQTPQILADQLAKLCLANFEYYQLCLTLRRGLQQTDLTLLTQTPENWAEHYAQTPPSRMIRCICVRSHKAALYSGKVMSNWNMKPFCQWTLAPVRYGRRNCDPIHGPSGFYGYFALSRHRKEPIRLQDYFHLSYLGHIIQEQAIPLFSPEQSYLSSREKSVCSGSVKAKPRGKLPRSLASQNAQLTFI